LVINNFSALRGENERLVNEVSEKNRIIDDLNKIRDEKEWSLGEHRQWLADANSRASDLEGTLKARDTTIESLRKEIDDLKKVSEEMQHLEVRLQEAQQHVSEPGKDEELKTKLSTISLRRKMMPNGSSANISNGSATLMTGPSFLLVNSTERGRVRKTALLVSAFLFVGSFVCLFAATVTVIRHNFVVFSCAVFEL
uniref:Uncharacterized protein n=1 Tax=Parascaris equorum TaxID=6256 RepID=A0A914S2K2_PAREQ